jgi:predicted MPP superfamily phosphohydrolase
MNWRLHGSLANAADDYRDSELVSRIARDARQGAAVVGVSRMGKTSLLYRLRDRPELPGCVFVNVYPEEPDATLHAMKNEARCFLLDEAQGLLYWGHEQLVRLRRKLEGRGFVMAGLPTLLQEERPPELVRLLENALLQWLPPFQLLETERMVRKAQSERPWEVEAKIAKAIHEATGGFPNLIARLCLHLTSNEKHPFRSPTKKELEALLKAFRGGSDPLRLIHGSLLPHMSEALDEHRAGRQAPLEVLQDTGLVISTGRKWRFTGSLFTLAWGPGSDWRPTNPPPPESARASATSQPAVARRPVFTWLHVSDLHFGGGHGSHQHSREEILKRMLMDVKKHRPGIPDRIFVTGDIAWKGEKQEFRAAASWLNELAAAAGVDPTALRLVPGNHDVDRGLTHAPSVRRHHEVMRLSAESLTREIKRRPVALLDESFEDPVVHTALRRKLEAYAGFLKELASHHPDDGEGEVLDWVEALKPAPQRPGRVWLVGLCSVWVSDEADRERKLFVGEKQLRLLKDVGEEDLLLVLTHHPPGWLHWDCEELLLGRMVGRARNHIHLCGHVHRAEPLVYGALGEERARFQFVAGAGHADAGGEHSYAWGALSWNETAGRWSLGWAKRVWVARKEEWRWDHTGHGLGDDGFVWQPLPLLKWAPPA